MAHAITSVNYIPEKERTKFQKAVSELENTLGCSLHTTNFTEYLAETEKVNARTIREWIKNKRSPYTESALEKTLEAIKLTADKDFKKKISTNLIPVSELPDLDYCIKKLNFRSFESMIKAISASVGFHITPHGVRIKNDMVRYEIKECLEGWLETIEKGQLPDINSKYTAIQKDRVLKIRDYIFSTGTYNITKLTQECAKDLKLNPDTLRTKYLNNKSHTKYVPVEFYKWMVKKESELKTQIYHGQITPIQGMNKEVYSPNRNYETGTKLYTEKGTYIGKVQQKSEKTIQVILESKETVTMTHNQNSRFF